MQNRAMREYATRRGWTIAMQVREVNPGAARRQAREKRLNAARRREIDLVLVWRLDHWGAGSGSPSTLGTTPFVESFLYGILRKRSGVTFARLSSIYP